MGMASIKSKLVEEAHDIFDDEDTIPVFINEMNPHVNYGRMKVFLLFAHLISLGQPIRQIHPELLAYILVHVL